MRRLSVAGLAGVLATCATAEIGPTRTPSGLARIEGDRLESGERLMVGDVARFQDDTYSFLWIEAKLGALLLVGRASGGTACPAEWFWVHTEPGDMRLSEMFGTCSDLVATGWDSETVTASMPSLDADEGQVDFVYDGRTVERVVRGQQPSDTPPSAGASAWIGRLAGEMFDASDWRAPLVLLLGEAAYAEAQDTIVIGSPMVVSHGWVAGGGCRPHACDVEVGAMAINLSDGRLLVALDGPQGPPRLWGQPNGPLPDIMAAVMSLD